VRARAYVNVFYLTTLKISKCYRFRVDERNTNEDHWWNDTEGKKTDLKLF